MDDDNSNDLNVDEFVKAMHDYRISDSDEEIQAIIQIFDRDGSGRISYDEFLRTIVGEMNEFRRNLCIQAFKVMDKTNDGKIDISDIKISYKANKHPDVMMGKRTENDVLYEFLDTFEANYAVKHPDSRDRVIELSEWLEYYNQISCNIDLDEYFEIMIKNAYKL